jgi:putative nucleotide binding protein|tara:strand:+ start:307 stop:858 length:552 start_codon:yes stop_codon:yes gene_type:complete
MKKEEYSIVLDYLPNGYPLEGKMMPIAQAIGELNPVLLELIPRRGVTLEIGERVYIGDGKRDKIYYILGRLKKEKITQTAKEELERFIEKIVKEKEKEFVEFFNKAEAINKRIHQIELLPGLGKKYMLEILKQREIKEFESFEDIKKRIQNLPFPEKAIEKRLFHELTTDERYNLFTQGMARY